MPEEFGTYLVYEKIGVGGMATVHRAEMPGIAGFRKTVALKRMLPHVAGNEDLVRSFVREARLASHLRHSNVAQTYDLGKVGDIYYIAMELVVGRTLREILRHCAKASIRVPTGITLNILAQVCDALDYAHNLCDESGQPFNIIHRDVSPSNIIVSESGLVKLIDFGIAKVSAAGMQTLSGTIKGKFGYMAPEYLMGKIDSRADLFAAGIVAHEMLTNRPLFQGRDDMDTLYRVRSMPIPAPSSLNPDIPPEIDSIVMTALERDPEVRWQRASAMRIALGTEIKRLGLTMLDQQVVEWCDSLFDDASFDTDMTTHRERNSRRNEPESVVIERVDPEDEDDPLAPPPVADSTRQLRKDQKVLGALPIAPAALAPPPQPPVALPSVRGAPVLSGERTRPDLKAARSTLHIEADDVLAEVALPKATVNATLAGVGPARISASQATAKPAAASRRMGALAILVLLLLTAAAAGAVVYFGLPYVQ